MESDLQYLARKGDRPHRLFGLFLTGNSHILRKILLVFLLIVLCINAKIVFNLMGGIMYNVHIIFGFEKSGKKIGGIFIGQKEIIKAQECILRDNTVERIKWFSGDCQDLTSIRDRTIDELSCIDLKNKIYRIRIQYISSMKNTYVEEIKNPCFILCIGANVGFINIVSKIAIPGAYVEVLVLSTDSAKAIDIGRIVKNNIIKHNLWIPTKHLHIHRGGNGFRY